MKKNIIKAQVYALLGTFIAVAGLVGLIIAVLYTAFAKPDTAVYIIICIVLIGAIFVGVKLEAYGKKFLNKNFRKGRRH